jgi:DNA polymerase III subunit chi
VAQVEFHSGVDEPLRFACRLLRKAWRQGSPVLVTAPAPTLQTLDRELWIFESQEFLPHLRVRPGQEIDAALRRTPIWLCDGDAPSHCPNVLLNLGGAIQADLNAFERIIEIVSDQPEQRQFARQRWREYEARGLRIKHHAQATGS